ncbi:MAG: PTS system mannose/fructose/sorbose family transporter subunit IID [Candidatus Krumholzibacteria bacterium]|nr:PTS system mannose/fructose/sorbose family transporter subunit IID [Candidatus Krumholzibacteria bacterium]
MKTMTRGLQWSLFLRSLTMQGSWNHQRMQNLGLLWTVLSWLRRTRRDVNRDRIICRRYYGFFNTNPYLANFLFGGLIRLENDQEAGLEVPPGVIGTFRDSVGRALASLGDQLFWLGLRPTLIMAICLFGLMGQIFTVLVVIGIFTVGQLLLRWVALRKGYDLGMDIVDLLFDPRWHTWIGRMKRAGMVLTGMVAGLYLAQVAEFGVTSDRNLLWIGTVLGMGLPLILRKRLPGELLIVAALFLALVLTFAI